MQSDKKHDATQTEIEIPTHPAAEIFPDMVVDEYDALMDDIKEHGQRDPIVLHNGRIIDGRNRYRACRELKIKARTRDWDANGSLVSYIVSVNLRRRHLTSSQRASVAVDALPLIEAEAKKRKAAGQKAGGKARHSASAKELAKANSHDTIAAEQAAKLTGTNRQYVADAKILKTESPELFGQVVSGEKTIPQAKRAAAKANPKQKLAPADKANAAKRKSSGKEVISPQERKDAKRAFGVITRFIDKLGLHDEVRAHLTAICSVIEGDADAIGGYEPEEARKPLEKLKTTLGKAAREWGDVKQILGDSTGLTAVFSGIDAASIALGEFKKSAKAVAQ